MLKTPKMVTEEMKSHLFEEYNDYFEDVTSVCPEFSDNDKIRLGVLLENINDAFDARFNSMINEDVVMTAPNTIKGLKTQYMDIVTAVFPNLIADQLFSVQPLQHKTGEIFYLRYVYGSNKDGATRGETIFGANELVGYNHLNYTKDLFEAEVETINALDSAVDRGFTGVLEKAPVEFESVKIVLDDGTKTWEIFDDGKGNLIYDNMPDGKSTIGTRYPDVTKCGTIVYSTGKYTVYVPQGTATTVTATWQSSFQDANNEANQGGYDATGAFDPTKLNQNRIPMIELTVDSLWVQAKPRKLRANYTLDAGYDLQQSQGIDIKEALLQAAAMELKNEIDGELIRTAYDGAWRQTSWNMLQSDADPRISRKEYYELFIEHIFKECSQIRQETKRVTGNFIVVGKYGSDILHFIGAPRFVGNTFTSSEVGPFFAGTLDGSIKVYVDPFLAPDEYLIGYKGNNLLDAGLIYCPYLLFFATETVMLDDFIGRRGFMTSYAKKMVNNKMYIAGNILGVNY